MGKVIDKFFEVYGIPPRKITIKERNELFKMAKVFESHVDKRNLYKVLNKYVDRGWLNFNVKNLFDALYFLKSGGLK